jgi:cholesterol 25-hydroxylase
MITYLGLPPLDVQDGILRAWWIDPLIATVSFGVFIHIYWYQERKLGVSCDDKFADTCGFGFGPLFNSAGAYWIGIFFWKLVVPPAAPFIPDGVPYNLSELAYLLTEVVTGIVLYDAIFFFLHWAMHEIPLLRTWHARHHDRPEGTLECRDTLRHSLMDGSLQVLINILVQRQNPWGISKSRLARAIHNVIVIWMLAESHTNSPVPYIWRRWFVGVREHRLHHYGALKQGAYGKHHRHQQFFGYLDDMRAWWTERQWQTRIVRVEPSRKTNKVV